MTNLNDNNATDELDEGSPRDTRKLDMQEWRERMAQWPETDLGIEASALLEEERVLRDAEIGWSDTLP